MDYKTYRENTFKNINTFDRTFHPETKWKNVKLSDMCPCNGCNVYKSYKERNEELPDTCPCLEKSHWDMECLEKFCWYEENDERLK